MKAQPRWRNGTVRSREFSTKNKRRFKRTEQITGGDGRDLRSFEIRFEFESDVPNGIRFEETCRLENFESAAHAVCRHTTNYAHSLFNTKHQPLRRL